WMPASPSSTRRRARSPSLSRRSKSPRKRRPWPSTVRPTPAPRLATYWAPRSRSRRGRTRRTSSPHAVYPREEPRGLPAAGFFIRLTKVSLPSMYTALPPPRDLARRCANGRLAVLDITGGVEPEPAPAGQPLRKDAALGALRAPLSSASDSPGLTWGRQHFRQRTGYQSRRR